MKQSPTIAKWALPSPSKNKQKGFHRVSSNLLERAALIDLASVVQKVLGRRSHETIKRTIPTESCFFITKNER
jgi:hypothetical protein